MTVTITPTSGPSIVIPNVVSLDNNTIANPHTLTLVIDPSTVADLQAQ